MGSWLNSKKKARLSVFDENDDNDDDDDDDDDNIHCILRLLSVHRIFMSLRSRLI